MTIKRQYSHEGISKLPDTTGVYILHRNHKRAYIGKSIHLRTRVYDHLRSGRAADWVTVILTDSEEEAIDVERTMIGSVCPKENELLKKGCSVDPSWWEQAAHRLGF